MRLTLFLFFLFLVGCTSGSARPDISIDLSDAQALFSVSSDTEATLIKKTTSEEALGVLRKLMSDGSIEPVILENSNASSVKPSSPIFIGPDGRVYMTFERVTVDGEDCRLVRVTTDSGEMECYGPHNGIGDNTTELFPSGDKDTADGFDFPSNHFDNEGNFYFLHWENNSSGELLNIIKKLSPSGEISTVIEYPYFEIRMEQYLVLQDGTIIYSTGATSRRTTADGGIENLDFDISAGDIVASNGDLLLYNSSFSTVTRVVSNGSEMTEEEIFPVVEDEAEVDELLALVTSAGTGFGSILEDQSGNIYVLLDVDNGTNGSIYRIYPGEPVLVSSMQSVVEGNENESGSGSITLARTAGNYLYFSGVDSDNNNIFHRVDLTDDTFPETDLLQGEDIEVFRFQVWSNGNILFGGLRFSDNQLILGEIDGESLEISVKTTTSTRVDDLVLLQ